MPQPTIVAHVLRLAVIALVALIALVARPAGAVSVPTPPGWSRAGVDRQIRSRVEDWAEAAGGHVDSVATPRSDDELTEVLAVIELGAALAPSSLGPEGEEEALAALRYDAQALLGIDAAPQLTGRVELGPGGLATIYGQWAEQEETFYIALVPAGRSHVAIVMALQSQSRVLYEAAFADLLPEILGAAAPIEPFAHARWLTIALLGWAVAAAATTFGIARVRLDLGAMAVARRAGAALGLAAIAVGVIAFVTVGTDVPALSAAGLSPAWISLRLAAGGVGAAVLLLAGAAVMERGQRPVSSAPTGGAFAPRPISSVINAQVQRRPSGAPKPHIEAATTPVVGVPILPATDQRLADQAATERPLAASGTVGSQANAADDIEIETRPDPPANLVLAAEHEADAAPRAAIASDAPERFRPVAEPGTPMVSDLERSGPATLHTEQILVDRGTPSDPVRRRVWADDDSV